MADLTKPMSDAAINQLDYFDKAQLYHNVYMNIPYDEIPTPLKKFYNEDPGLIYLKSVLMDSNLQNPYEIAKLIKALKPAKPQTLQEIYNRAKYLADVCDTSIEKILRSDLFNSQDFIPQLTEENIVKTLKNGALGNPVTLKPDDYTPAPSGGDDSGDDPVTPTIEGDYADENKIYFNANGDSITCNKSFSEVISKLPKLPDAELVRNAADDYQNISNIACGYDPTTATAHFNFAQIYTTNILLFTIHYSASGIIMEENEFMIDANIQ